MHDSSIGLAVALQIVDETKAYQCKACRHRCLTKEMKALDLHHCPLCHSAISSQYGSY